MAFPVLHYVNTDLKLFANPNDIEVPSAEHPCIPVFGRFSLALLFKQGNGWNMPLSDRASVSMLVTQDGRTVFSVSGNDVDLSRGLEGIVAFLMRPLEGVELSTGSAQMSVLVDGNIVLNDSVAMVEAPSYNPVGCGCAEPSSLSDLEVIEQYVEPSEEMEGKYVLYLGPMAQLVKGCVYLCEQVDGSWTWIRKTEPSGDDLRLVEWEP